MNTHTVSLVISSQTVFDTERVTKAMGIDPTEIWKRKPGLKVHGPDTIPQMSWIFEQTGEESLTEATILTLLDRIPGLDALNKVTTEMNLRASIVCRVRLDDVTQELDLTASALGRLSSNSLRLIWSAELTAG
jgi:hypothetical protein